MGSDVLGRVLSTLSRIDLLTVQSAADLQTRVDRKYVVPPSVVHQVIEHLESELCVLEIDGSRQSRYESVYFDTPGLECFRAAAHGRRQRVKVRTRSYLDSGLCMLEVKRVSARGSTIKERLDHPLASRSVLDARGRDFLLQHGVPQDMVSSLGVRLVTDYYRTTLLSSDGSRTTLDTDLRCITPDGTSCGVGDLIVLETKSAGHPTIVDRALWRLGCRPEPISKYGTGLAALSPQLPANKWNRTLRRHFEPGGATAAKATEKSDESTASVSAARTSLPRHARSVVFEPAELVG